MSIIYEPKGKAREYCELAANLYGGCSHGCKYCYAPAATFTSQEVFGRARVRPGCVTAIKKEAPAYAGREILLCFTCDPYQPLDEKERIARKAILELKIAGANFNVLTKGGLRAQRDFDLYGYGDKIGATLTFNNDSDSLEWEPGAALPSDRIEMLSAAKKRGIHTWASLEPVIDPEQSLDLIRKTAGIVDKYKVGKWNHDARASAIDWSKFALNAIDLLESIGVQYMLKKDLIAWLPESHPLRMRAA